MLSFTRIKPFKYLVESGDKKMRVNLISPGAVDTPILNCPHLDFTFLETTESLLLLYTNLDFVNLLTLQQVAQCGRSYWLWYSRWSNVLLFDWEGNTMLNNTIIPSFSWLLLIGKDFSWEGWTWVIQVERKNGRWYRKISKREYNRGAGVWKNECKIENV